MTNEPRPAHTVIPMHTIGLLHGMSSQATSEYYRRLNDVIQARAGGHMAAELVLYSVNFANIEAFVRAEQWEAAADYLVERARRVERGGADFLLIGSNTMHRVAPAIEAAVSIPLVHIVDVTAEAILAAGLQRVGVLGTWPTMQADFYRARFHDCFGIELISPDEDDARRIDTIIFDELVHGVLGAASKTFYLEVIRRLTARGAQGVILGCTEIDLLIGQADVPDVPLFDTTALHVQKAVRLALGEETWPPSSAGR